MIFALPAGPNPTLMAVVGSLTAVDHHVARGGSRTDLGEMAAGEACGRDGLHAFIDIDADGLAGPRTPRAPFGQVVGVELAAPWRESLVLCISRLSRSATLRASTSVCFPLLALSAISRMISNWRCSEMVP